MNLVHVSLFSELSGCRSLLFVLVLRHGQTLYTMTGKIYCLVILPYKILNVKMTQQAAILKYSALPRHKRHSKIIFKTDCCDYSYAKNTNKSLRCLYYQINVPWELWNNLTKVIPCCSYQRHHKVLETLWMCKWRKHFGLRSGIEFLAIIV
jgi:hypothetical protein